jgi:hypothetical protein
MESGTFPGVLPQAEIKANNAPVSSKVAAKARAAHSIRGSAAENSFCIEQPFVGFVAMQYNRCAGRTPIQFLEGRVRILHQAFGADESIVVDFFAIMCRLK